MLWAFILAEFDVILFRLFLPPILVPVDGSPALARINCPRQFSTICKPHDGFPSFVYAVSEQIKQHTSQDRPLLYPDCLQPSNYDPASLSLLINFFGWFVAHLSMTIFSYPGARNMKRLRIECD